MSDPNATTSTEGVDPLLFGVALVWTHSHEGREKVAVVRDSSGSLSLPKAALALREIHNVDVIREKLRLGFPIELRGIVQIECNKDVTGEVIRVYWHGRVACDGLPSRELGSPTWLSAKRAVCLLNSPQDLKALQSYIATAPRLIEGGWSMRLPIIGRFTSLDGRRLLGELRRLSVRLSSYPRGRVHERHFQAAQDLFGKALLAFYQRDFSGSWKCLGDAMRCELFLMDNDSFRAQEVIIEEEGKKKLNGYRAKAFRRLMRKVKDKHSPELLGKALALISDSQETRFYSIDLIQQQVNVVVIILMIVSVLFLIDTRWIDNFSTIPSDFGTKHLIGSFLLGAAGACVSTLISLSGPQELRIPDRMMNSMIAFARPFVGGGSALISSFVLLSHLVGFGTPSLALIYVIAFAFGLSERLVISTVSKLNR